MLSIYAPTEFHDQLEGYICREDRLHEVVRLVDLLAERPQASAHSLMIRNGELHTVLDWHNRYPPYILPGEIPLKAETFLGLVYARLDNYERCHDLLAGAHRTLYLELDIINRLQQGLSVSSEELPSSYTPFEEYRLMHNQAVVMHYGPDQTYNPDKHKYFYLEALQSAPNDEYRAFTGQQFALLLLDEGALADAERVLQLVLNGDISPDARIELSRSLTQVWLQQLSPPYQPERLQELRTALRQILSHYEEQDREIDQALTLMDAGNTAHFLENWSEALGCFNKSLTIFQREGLDAMAAEVHYRKGTLLLAWAQQNNPQFYRQAADSLQKAVQVFTRAETPEVYADIQHHLGIIYADIPDDIKKKGIWAGVSTAAFREALDIYKKNTHPYQYGTVCNHYGNALTKYPQAKLSDNFEKALYYYQEALQVRNAAEYPVERSLTLLNYLHAQWHLNMEEDRFDEQRFRDMVQKAEEVLSLTDDPALQREARNHLEKLANLKAAYA